MPNLSPEFVLTIASLVVAVASLAISLSLYLQKRSVRSSRGRSLPVRISGFSKRATVTIGLVATVAAVVAIAVTTLRLLQPAKSPSSGPSPTVAIRSPLPNSVVPESGFTLDGSVSHLPAGTVLWGIGKGAGITDTLQPSNHSCVITNKVGDNADFSCGQFYVGGSSDTGRRFTVYVVIADGQAVAAFLDYDASNPASHGYPGLAALPVGANIAAEVTVRRE